MGNTRGSRGSRAIDRIFTNVSRGVKEASTVEPLETEGEGEELRRSDHRIAYCRILLQRRQAYSWVEYSYRHYSDKSVRLFRSWVVINDWREVLEAETLDTKAEMYQKAVTEAMERFFLFGKLRRKAQIHPG